MNTRTDTTMLIGRVLISVIFILGGWGKLIAPAATQAAFAREGAPLVALAYPVAVAIELGGGLALLLGLFTRPVGAALGLWCIATALVAHTNFSDRNMEIHFLKNLAMAGGLAYVAAFGAGAISLDAALRRRRIAAR
ncbi:MAG: DoxX family protein [Acidisphaera sp.]|nr:DoxX family protein [Acidisphaera sp.]